MRHPQIAARVFHTPLLAAPAKAAAFIMGLGSRVLGTEREISVIGAEASEASRVRPQASLLDERLEEDLRNGRRSGYRVIDSVAVIPVTGTLVHRGAWLGESSGETSYEGLAAQIEAAATDYKVRGIALEIDSFGGEVAGCFALADQIRAVREKKPVWAFVSDHAYSAGYAIASQADHIVVPRTAGVGSIGVIAMHADYSGRLDAMGVQVTVISAGAHKADGNPYEPLPESVRASLSAEMENLRQIFAETVAAGRGDRLSAADALATEAATFLGAAAVEAGLADEVANPRIAFESFIEKANGRTARSGVSATTERTEPMTKKTDGPDATAQPTAPDANAQAPAPDATSTPPAAASAPAPASPPAQAPAAPSASDERARISAIMNHPEASGREELAKSLAFNSDMSAEEAGKHLAAAPKAQPAQGFGNNIDAEATELSAPSPAATEARPGIAARAKERYAN
ncbi:Putative signal peptide peptidase SppA [Roseivivax sp. THAF40]|uniref:S49 family peptidase n=1 Tax=Roseivivax sp. THAF40 TaxID=2587858 RepID=UPI0012698084|nr:S49 family peptidase [Roseivivax sp. THAF40]QFT47820.1 Putative signal peptide peptidase SppA [Roseivivax sp. THAF40]